MAAPVIDETGLKGKHNYVFGRQVRCHSGPLAHARGSRTASVSERPAAKERYLTVTALLGVK
jgi:hypothetical protein